jgi:hypothetical protein
MPPLIRSRYEQYKRDTQQFTTWLAQTAISFGYPVSKFDKRNGADIGEIFQSAASKKNAKKKARAKAKKSKLAEDEDDEGEENERIQDSRSGECPITMVLDLAQTDLRAYPGESS